jgi:hypothetical protein
MNKLLRVFIVDLITFDTSVVRNGLQCCHTLFDEWLVGSPPLMAYSHRYVEERARKQMTIQLTDTEISDTSIN